MLLPLKNNLDLNSGDGGVRLETDSRVVVERPSFKCKCNLVFVKRYVVGNCPAMPSAPVTLASSPSPSVSNLFFSHKNNLD